MTDTDFEFDDPNGLRRTVAEYGVGEQVLVNRMIIVAMFREIDRLRVELGEQDGWQAEAKARIAELEAELDMCTADCAAERQDRTRDD